MRGENSQQFMLWDQELFPLACDCHLFLTMIVRGDLVDDTFSQGWVSRFWDMTFFPFTFYHVCKSCLGHHTWQKITVDWSSATHMCVCVCSCRIPCWWLFFHGSFESEKLTIGFAGLFFFFSSSSGETRCGWQCRCLSVVHIRRVNGSWCPDNG